MFYSRDLVSSAPSVQLFTVCPEKTPRIRQSAVFRKVTCSKGFSGVLVSDYYSAYDSLECLQQKCLIHLMRDFNHDIQGNPWDEELKSLAGKLGSLLREIVATIDKHGLKHRYLVKHKMEIDCFFGFLAADTFRSDLATNYRERLLKCRDKLFTFLDHDGIPWNNNPAEHAVKQFAYYRENIDG